MDYQKLYLKKRELYTLTSDQEEEENERHDQEPMCFLINNSHF